MEQTPGISIDFETVPLVAVKDEVEEDRVNDSLCSTSPRKENTWATNADLDILIDAQNIVKIEEDQDEIKPPASIFLHPNFQDENLVRQQKEVEPPVFIKCELGEDEEDHDAEECEEVPVSLETEDIAVKMEDITVKGENESDSDSVKNIKKQGEHQFLVPSSRNDKMFYEVDSSIGWCTCPQGSRGAFCKHQIAVYEVHRIGFPKIPAINGHERYKLGCLALGDKCPSPAFFQGIRESGKEIQVIPPDEETDYTPAPNLPVGETPPEDLQPVSNENSTETKSCEDLHKEIIEALNKVHVLASQNPGETYKKTQEALLKRLTKNASPNQALDTYLRLAAARGLIRKRGTITVQPTAISRRKEGKSRGAKRQPAGRPPANEPPTKKRMHQLSQSVRKNVRHVKKHGEGH